MGTFMTGFLTGFANTLNKNIQEKEQISRDYFQKQYELATTVGLENHRRVEEEVKNSTKLAKQLQQMGVPKNIIMAVASQDPMGLQDFYADIAKAQASGIVLDEAFFSDFVEVSKDFQAPDEDFYAFFKRTLSPITAQAAADPEAFKKDRKGGIVAALFGGDPYEEANRKLAETPVIEGLSAADLLKYSKGASPAGSGQSPTVTYDYSAIARPKEAGTLTISEIGQLDKAFEETWKTLWAGGEGVSKEEAQLKAVDAMLKKYGEDPEALDYLTTLREELSAVITESPLEEGAPTLQELSDLGIDGAPNEPPATAPETAPTAPVEETATTPAPEAEEASPEPAPAASGPIDPEGEGLILITIKGHDWFWWRNNSDGTVTYSDENGEELVLDPAELRQFVSQYGTNYSD